MTRATREHQSIPNPWLLFFFATGAFLPWLALLVKPLEYSFYMFFPATPPGAVDRARLLAANGLLVAGLIVSATAAIGLCAVAVRKKEWGYLLFPIIVVLHPLLQPVFLEQLDTQLNYRWYSRVLALDIVGKGEDEVEDLIGAPSWRIAGTGYTIWKYKPLPIYWMGSAGEVVFVDGRVSNIQANDD